MTLSLPWLNNLIHVDYFVLIRIDFFWSLSKVFVLIQINCSFNFNMSFKLNLKYTCFFLNSNSKLI